MHPLTEIDIAGFAFADSPVTLGLLRRDGPLTAPQHGRDAPGEGIGIDLRGVGKSFGARRVLEGIDLMVGSGEFVVIVGRSGCGKSTLLRLVAGLEEATSGSILVGGERCRLHHDDVRIMFQDPRLLPWKRVIDNVAIGLRGRNALANAHAALGQVGLAERYGDWPAVLSGGQRQRVALARALVHQPRLLLLDEPLGALDALTRIEMQRLIESVWRRNAFTALLVTHDVQEAIALADRVLVIDGHEIALDCAVDLARPRARGTVAFARLEDRILRQVVGHA